MKTTLVVVAIALMAARAHAGVAYGAPEEPAPHVSQVYKHVYIHTGEDEPVEVQNRVIRVPGGDRHVNIIFVKTPSQQSIQETEVILPEPDSHKNLVYVLLKKGENRNNVQVRGPAPTRPTKPEVFFIRYKNQEQQQEYGAPAPAPVRTPSGSYGSPF